MTKNGLNTAGTWQDCPFCQSRQYYEINAANLTCEKCHLTIEQARVIDDQRPSLISVKPNRVTSGSLIEISYYGSNPLKPVLLSISWFPTLGNTSVRLFPEDAPAKANLYKISVEVPLGATSAVIFDTSGTSKKLNVSIDYISVPYRQEKESFLKKLFKI